MTNIAILTLALLAFTGCAHRPIRDCNVQRIADSHREELSQMLSNYPSTTMEMLRTIATLEQEAGGYR
jgi:hypothetical protein